MRPPISRETHLARYNAKILVPEVAEDIHVSDKCGYMISSSADFWNHGVFLHLIDGQDGCSLMIGGLIGGLSLPSC